MKRALVRLKNCVTTYISNAWYFITESTLLLDCNSEDIFSSDSYILYTGPGLSPYSKDVEIPSSKEELLGNYHILPYPGGVIDRMIKTYYRV